LKIGIDTRTVTPIRSGVGNYVLNLLEGLRWVAPQQEFFLLGQKKNLETIGWNLPSGMFHTSPLSHESHPWGDLWEHFLLPQTLQRAGVDVFHGPATLIPLAGSGFARVVTIHDLVAFLFSDTIPKKYALYMRWLIRQVVQKADRIISVSEHTKQDLIDVLKVDPAKVTVVYEAAPPGFQPIRDRTKHAWVRRRYNLKGPFLYHVGNIEPRKNLVRLVKAFLLMRQRSKLDVQLVITGQKGWLTSMLFRELDYLQLGDEVVFTGYVPRTDLPLLMNAAEAFVFPSLYEGFGLPALEAMSCGTPVVTSNISSLPEVVGEAAVLVDPERVESIARGMEAVLIDSDLRELLAKEGLAQARRFSWERAARETLEVYRRVYEEKRRR
jgi:glycosyltransferase involved in cell wall biosynthesis